MKNISEKQIEEASKLTKKELAFINKITKEVIYTEQRPLVYLALCSSIIGCILRAGVLQKKTAMLLISKGIE